MFHGWAQLVADGVKFVQKEDVVPAAADRTVFKLAPAVALLPYLVAMLVDPARTGHRRRRTSTSGMFFVLAVMGVGVIGTLMGGWSSANKFSLLGGIRVAAQLMAYELPFVLAAASVAMAAGTLSLTGIVEAWQPWWLLWQGIALVVFFVAGLAELQRPPFDMPVADAEIVFGPYTEYGGLRFALFILAEYAGIVVLSALTAVLFLGGWHGPFEDTLGLVWTLVKTFAVAFVVIWVRVAYPRMREDQLQRLAWQGLVPLALLQLAITAVGVVVQHEDPRTGEGPRGHLAADDPAVGHRALPGRDARAAAPLARRDRADRGELHLLHALRARVPGLVHLHRLAQGRRPGQPPRAARTRPATCSTASRSTSRSACTARSASRSARSTRCTGARSSSTPSSTSAS